MRENPSRVHPSPSARPTVPRFQQGHRSSFGGQLRICTSRGEISVSGVSQGYKSLYMLRKSLRILHQRGCSCVDESVDVSTKGKCPCSPYLLTYLRLSRLSSRDNCRQPWTNNGLTVTPLTHWPNSEENCHRSSCE